ncbi:MAG TPA: hypothetical protein VGF63_07925 [Solirubrobacteraceae bacterium]
MLDESPSGASSPDVVGAIAATAAADPSTIAFIGDQTSGDTATTLPILNRAGILEFSPTATYGGLTRNSTDRAEPAKYYPTGRRTFARVVPSDSAQAAARRRTSAAPAAPGSTCSTTRASTAAAWPRRSSATPSAPA